MSAICPTCAGCAVKDAVEAFRLARLCNRAIFASYVREWSEWEPLPGVRKRVEHWHFLRYLVAASRQEAWRRLWDIFPGATTEDVLLVVGADAAYGVMLGDERRVVSALLAARAGELSDVAL